MTMIVGHRAVGASETTLEHFQQAIDLGLEMVEFDLRMTADQQLVIYHGPPGMEGVNIIREQRAADLEQQLGYHLPRLSEVIDLAGGQLRFDLEIKEADILAAIIDQLGGVEQINADQHVITSFIDPVVAEAKQAGLTAGLILGRWGIGWRQRLSEIIPDKRKIYCQADFLLPEQRIYRLAPALGPFSGAWLWGVNSDRQIRRALADERIAAIITDYPQRARELLADMPNRFST